MTAPTYVNSGTFTNAAGAATITPVLPGSLVTDNLLVAWVYGSSGNRVITLDAASITNGWTLGGTITDASDADYGWAWRVVDGAELAPVFNFSGTEFALIGRTDQFTGTDPTSPIGATTGAHGTSSSAALGTVVTTANDSLILGHIVAGQQAPATPTNFTSAYSGSVSNGNYNIVTQTQATHGTTSDACTATLGGSTWWGGHVIEVRSEAAFVPVEPIRTDADVSQVLALTVYAGPGDASISMKASEVVSLAVYAPGTNRYARASQMLALVPYTSEGSPEDIDRVSQMLHLVVWGNESAVEDRNRAWGFVMDGHPMYVLDLGLEGTFIFDLVTKQWSNFRTSGHVGWNMKNGTVWGTTNRILGGDTHYPYVWEMKPGELLDESFRPIEHVVTGGIPLRSRVFVSMSALRVAASSGQIMEDTGALFTMRFSDDNGKTWSADYVLELSSIDYSQDLAWRSLGSFMAPGRVIELSDSGGLLRIDGADVFLDGFDDERLPQEGGGGGGQQG